MRQKFYDVATVWNLTKKDIKKYYGSWEYFYEQFKKGNVPVTPQQYSDIHTSGLWIESGCPYYKIYPGIIDKFLKTRIDIDSSLLRLPHKCFAIRIPEFENPILSWKDDDRLFYIKSILVFGDEEVITYALNFTCDQWESRQEPAALMYRNFKNHNGMTVEQVFAKLGQLLWDDLGTTIPQEILDACTRLIAGVCFIATGSHKILQYDVLAEHLEAYEKLKEGSPKRKEYEIKAKRKGKFGWNIGIGEGRNLRLPNGVSYVDACREAGSREHMYSHIRGGHWHTVCFGTKHSDRKVKWFENTIVRPDLPMKIAS